MNKDTQKYYLAAVVAFTVWGFFPMALRAVKVYSPGEILYFRIFFSFLVCMLLIITIKRKALLHDRSFFLSLTSSQRRLVVWLMVAGGVLLTVNWLSYIYVVNAINIKTASFTYLVCPVLTAVLGVILLKEQMNSLQWLAVFLCTLSCVLIGMNSTLELGYSLFTATSYALYLISQRKLQGFDRMVLLAIQVAFSLLFLTLFTNYLIVSVPTDPGFYWILFAIAVVFTIFPLYLNLYALNRINSATIGILMYINPLLNFALALTFFHESINTLQKIGYGIILLALVLFNIPNFVRLKNSYLEYRDRA